MSLAWSVWNVAHTTPAEKGKKQLPQAAHARQDEEEWETEDEEEIVGWHEEAEPEEQDALNHFVNLA